MTVSVVVAVAELGNQTYVYQDPMRDQTKIMDHYHAMLDNLADYQAAQFQIRIFDANGFTHQDLSTCNPLFQYANYVTHYQQFKSLINDYYQLTEQSLIRFIQNKYHIQTPFPMLYIIQKLNHRYLQQYHKPLLVQPRYFKQQHISINEIHHKLIGHQHGEFLVKNLFNIMGQYGWHIP